MVSWGQYDKNHNTDPYRIQIENVYNIPTGWYIMLKKCENSFSFNIV